MSYISVDIEADGPVPHLYSMVSFGAVLIDDEGKFDKTFFAKIKPISEKWIPESLAISGYSREDTLYFEEPVIVMQRFANWIKQHNIGRAIFIADNNGFDWQFINYYFHAYTGNNPFGFSSTNLGSIYKGLVKDSFKNFKHLRKTRHSHNPVDDATGNAEAFYTIVKQLNYKAKL